MDKQIEYFLSGLEPVIRQARDEQAKADRRDATRFSVFGYFADRETAISRIIADLLDPQGSHGQGTVFLRLFGQYCMRGLTVQPPAGAARCQVRLEEATAQGRRVDIVVRFPDGVIGIENKPWTIDQADQLTDYIRHFGDENWVMLYLSGSGGAPSTESILEEKRLEYEKSGRFRTIPFLASEAGVPSLEAWLEAAHRDCEAERVRWFLRDCLAYIRSQFDPRATESNIEVSMIEDYIRDRFLKEALAVENAMPGIRKALIQTVLRELEDCLRGGEWDVDGPSDDDIVKSNAFLLLRKTHWHRGNGVAIGTDSEGWSSAFIGVSCGEQILQEEARRAAQKSCINGSLKTSGAKYGWAGWNRLPGDFGNWRKAEFLSKVAEESTRAALVGELAGMMTALAKAVEPVFDEKCK